MIDSHTHLFLCERPEADLVDAAREAGVERMLNVGLDVQSSRTAIAAAERCEGVFATVGCHPTEAAGFDGARAAAIDRLAAEHDGCGRSARPGSTTTATPRAGRSSDARSPRRSRSPRERELPIVIHARDPEGETGAVDEVFDTLDAHGEGVR